MSNVQREYFVADEVYKSLSQARARGSCVKLSCNKINKISSILSKIDKLSNIS